MVAEVFRLAEFVVDERRVYACRAFEEVFPRQAHEGGGDEPHRGKDGIPPAQMVRHRQGHDVVAVGLFAQVALLFVGDEQHMLVPRVGERPLQPRLHEKVLGQRFDGPAGFADGDDDGFFGIEGGHLRFEHIGVHVVQNPQPRPLVVREILLREKGLLECACAEGRAADAQHDHMLETPELRGERLEAGRQAAAEGQVEERKFARGHFTDEAGIAAVELRLKELERLRACRGRRQQPSGPCVLPIQSMHTVS